METLSADNWVGTFLPESAARLPDSTRRKWHTSLFVRLSIYVPFLVDIQAS
jgi:hypothetical protein